jgi:uncharacterized damage-inducible protein DinB/protein tyrosine phosphatase (PTP) superfamily phosphohydrolase (DUF442 family)
MELRAYAVALATYNRWMNERLYAAAALLPDEERKRDRGAFFKSIHGTLNHLLLGDQSWLQRFRGEAVTMKAPDEELFADFGELREARRQLDRDLLAWAEGLDEAFGAAPFRFYSVSYGRHRELPGWALVVHVFNHQTHHRGQVTTLLKQQGLDPGITDLPWMPYFDEPGVPAGKEGNTHAARHLSVDAGASPEWIRNFLAVDPRLATGGQPTEAQLGALARAGYQVVINLGLLDPRYCLPDEAALVAGLGLAYHHVPVQFDAPAAADFDRFAALMDGCREQRTFVHCAANYRVSAFVALYGERRFGWTRAEADAHIRRLWEPNATWQAFLDERRASR